MKSFNTEELGKIIENVNHEEWRHETLHGTSRIFSGDTHIANVFENDNDPFVDKVINTTLSGNTLNELMLEFFNKIMSIRHDINHSLHIVDDEMEANFDAWSRGLLH